MPKLRRALIVAAVTSMTVAGLGVAAFADEVVLAPLPDVAGPAVEQPESVARGLIIKTTTASPSDDLIAATERAADSEVVDESGLLTKVSVVEFDETVPASVAADAAADVQQRSDVVWAAPDTLRQATEAPPVSVDDVHFPSQRNLWDTKTAGGGYSIKAPSIWQKTRGRSDVRVAVLDTGITQHEDIVDNLVPGYDMILDDEMGHDNQPGRDDDNTDPGDWGGRGPCPTQQPASDSSWHGTFVAGQISATTDNQIGVAGAAPGVKVMPVRVLGRCGGYDSDIMAGIEWATGGDVPGVPSLSADDAAEVANLSLGSYDRVTERREASCEAYAAVTASARDRGAVVVAAAGNDGGNANLAVPASCDGVVSVGATSLRGFGAAYSNFGSSVDISAPGGDSRVEGYYDSVLGLSNTGTTTAGADTVVRFNGTSMAAPQVAAAAALFRSLLKDANVSPDDMATEVELAIDKAAAPFRPRSTEYAKKKVPINGSYYTLDLNCSKSAGCGDGLLDLSRWEVPLDPPQITGDLAVGEQLTASTGTWVRTPADRSYVWKRDGEVIEGATSSTYVPVVSDEGKALSVTVTPRTAPFDVFPSESAATDPVPDGPEVVLEVPTTGTHGVSATATVTVDGAGPGGTVEIRRGSAVLASDVTNDTGVATIEVPGLQWLAGTNDVRATYLGGGTVPLASSAKTTVSVRKASASFTSSLISKIRSTTRAKMSLNITVPGVSGPTGALKVYDGSRLIANSYLYGSSGGKKTLPLPLLKKGTHNIRVRYDGTANINPKWSPTERIVSK